MSFMKIVHVNKSRTFCASMEHYVLDLFIVNEEKAKREVKKLNEERGWVREIDFKWMHNLLLWPFYNFVLLH